MNYAEVIDRIERVAEQIDLSRFPIPLKLWVSHPVGGGGYPSVMVYVSIVVPARDTREQTTITFRRPEFLDLLIGASDHEILKRLRWHLQQVILHELDEQLWVGDQRAFDPHRSEGDLSTITVGLYGEDDCRRFKALPPLHEGRLDVGFEPSNSQTR